MEVVRLIQTDRDNAIAELYRRYATLVMGLCLKYLRNTVEAEDILMLIFEKLEDKVSKSEIKHFKSWLYTVSRNECLMLLRKKKTATSDIDIALISTADNSEVELESALLKETELIELETALQQLKPEQKKAISLFYLENKSYDEISSELKIDLKKVKSLIQNGKRNLKIKMEEIK